MADSARPPNVVDGVGLDSLEYKPSTKEVGIKIYGDFGTEEGQRIVVKKLEFALVMRVRLAASLGLPLPGSTPAHLLTEEEVQRMYNP